MDLIQNPIQWDPVLTATGIKDNVQSQLHYSLSILSLYKGDADISVRFSGPNVTVISR